jgi:hypothetical protein
MSFSRPSSRTTRLPVISWIFVGSGDLEGIGKRNQQELAHLADRQHEVFLTKLLRNALERLRHDAIAGNVVRREIQGAGLGHEAAGTG